MNYTDSIAIESAIAIASIFTFEVKNRIECNCNSHQPSVALFLKIEGQDLREFPPSDRPRVQTAIARANLQ
ncbi:hypothetical protein JJD41_20175 [Oxynema sp. CENA135]|uniref:hypothetical protein n=1 Tax=Oxynema sp. CENA135 TaxID=984206 RepID=UPI00190CA4B1|nr:hypothetical protein [Oxynema sp. CENA135]MBK4732164.1 hypothetical protein [Oxynema sp. CENA135]